MSRPATYNDFIQTLEMYADPPQDWPEALRSIWYDAKGNWNASHNIAQDLDTVIGSWIHGYLHRKEGDEFNARYWYSRANRAFPIISLEEEHHEIVVYILSR